MDKLESVFIKDLGWQFEGVDNISSIEQHEVNRWVTIKYNGSKDMLVNPDWIIALKRK
jgi:hypothetical protein